MTTIEAILLLMFSIILCGGFIALIVKGIKVLIQNWSGDALAYFLIFMLVMASCIAALGGYGIYYAINAL